MQNFQGDINQYSGHIKDYPETDNEDSYFNDLHSACDFALEVGAPSYLQIVEDSIELKNEEGKK